MPKTEGHKDFEKQKEAYKTLEPIDFYEKRYSYKDMASLEDAARLYIRILTIIDVVLCCALVVCSIFEARH